MRARFSRLVGFHSRSRSASAERELGRLHRADRAVARDHGRLAAARRSPLARGSRRAGAGGAQATQRGERCEAVRRAPPRADSAQFPVVSVARRLERHRRARLELARAGRDHRERVGAEQRGDDVRALRPVRDATVSRPFWRSRRTRTACSRSRLRRTAAPRAASGRAACSSALAPCSAASAGRDEQREGDDGRHRIAGQAEHERVVAAAEPGRLAGLQRDAPEELVRRRALASAGLTWSWGPTETPPETITTSAVSSAPREARLGGGAVVGQAVCGGAADAAPGARRARPASAPLELWISPGPSGSPGALSSSPVHSTWTAGPARHGQLAGAGGDRRAQLGGAEPRAGFAAPWCRRACPRRGRGCGRRGSSRSRVVIVPSCGVDVLLADDRGGAGGNGAAGRDPDRLAVAERVGRSARRRGTRRRSSGCARRGRACTA